MAHSVLSCVSYSCKRKGPKGTSRIIFFFENDRERERKNEAADEKGNNSDTHTRSNSRKCMNDEKKEKKNIQRYTHKYLECI